MMAYEQLSYPILVIQKSGSNFSDSDLRLLHNVNICIYNMKKLNLHIKIELFLLIISVIIFILLAERAFHANLWLSHRKRLWFLSIP